MNNSSMLTPNNNYAQYQGTGFKKRTPHAKTIFTMAVIILFASLALAAILGFSFKAQTLEVGAYSSKVKETFNWSLAIGTFLCGSVLSFLFDALSHIAQAIEEGNQSKQT